MVFCSNPASLSSPELLSSTPRGCWSVGRSLVRWLGWWSASQFVTFSLLARADCHWAFAPSYLLCHVEQHEHVAKLRLVCSQPCSCYFYFLFHRRRSHTPFTYYRSMPMPTSPRQGACRLAGWLAGENEQKNRRQRMHDCCLANESLHFS
jgi:hypothetical protein